MNKPKWYVPADQRSVQDMSLDDIRSMVYDAVRKKYSADPEAYVSEVFFSSAIIRRDGKYYRIGYGIVDDAVQLGSEETEVEQKWIEARAAAAEDDPTDDNMQARMTLGKAAKKDGSAWEVTVCEEGNTLNGWHLPAEALRAAADEGVFEDCNVCIYELPKGATHVPDTLFDLKGLLVENKVGALKGVRYVAGLGLTGTLHFLEHAKWIGKNLLKVTDSGDKAPYGLSYDCAVRAVNALVAGVKRRVLKKILSADSVDIVTRPAAGGKFNRAIAAQTKEGIMTKQELWDLITRMRGDLLEGKTFEKTDEDELRAIAVAMEPAQAPGTLAKKPDTPAAGGDNGVALLRSEMAIDKALVAAELPELAATRVRAMFDGKVTTPEDIQRAIASEKDYLASMNPAPAAVGDEAGLRGHDLRVGLDTVTRAQMAMDRAFGLTGEDMKLFSRMDRLDNQPFFDDPVLRSVQDLEGFDDVPAFSSLREMYTFFSGDGEVTGRFYPKRLVSRMDITSGTFTYLMGNTMGRRLVKEYRATDFLESLLISTKKPVKDFRTQEAVNVGYFPDVATVDPEAADYEEIAAVTDEESTYSIGQKGNLFTISRKTIINDDITTVKALNARFGRAFRRTHGKYVWAFYLDNDTCSDGTAWFTNGHGNLGSSALTISTALVAYKAIGNRTEKDSGELIGLLAGGGVIPNLVGGISIIDLLQTVEQDEHYYATNDLTDKTRNPLKGKVKAHVIPVEDDTNDWGILLPPSEVDMVEMGYLNGRQEPEFFLADAPTSEQMFVADKMRYKGRHEYAGALVDNVSGYKAIVT